MRWGRTQSTTMRMTSTLLIILLFFSLSSLLPLLFLFFVLSSHLNATATYRCWCAFWYFYGDVIANRTAPTLNRWVFSLFICNVNTIPNEKSSHVWWYPRMRNSNSIFVFLFSIISPDKIQISCISNPAQESEKAKKNVRCQNRRDET